MDRSRLRIRCEGCGRARYVTEALFEDWPDQQAMSEKDERSVKEFLEQELHRLKCKNCGERGQARLKEVKVHRTVEAPPASESDLDTRRGRNQSSDRVEWNDRVARSCERCTRGIRPTRLRLRPNIRLCEECEQLSAEEAEAQANTPPCPRCGSKLVLRMPRGTETAYFLGCTSYPRCRYTE